MTSKLVVNTIEADTGISSVSFASSISMSSTSVFHFSDAGVNIGADTNINRAGNGVLGFNINSSEKARITSAGNVGIGTDNPSADHRATIKSSTSPHSALLLDTTESNYNTNLYFAKQGTTKWIIGNKASDDAFRIVSGTSSERFRIDSSGRMIIGKVMTAGSGPYYDDLTINNSNQSGVNGGVGIDLISSDDSYGALVFSDNSAHGRGYVKYTHAGNNDYMRFGTQGTDRWEILSGGHFTPSTNGVFDIGSSSKRVRDGYFDGNLGIGNKTTAARNAGVSTVTGALIYNTTTNALEVYNGSSWLSVTSKEGTFNISYLVVGGGGAGGGNYRGGGGGAGALRTNWNNETQGGGTSSGSAKSINIGTSYAIGVGTGGTGQGGNYGWSGATSTFDDIVSKGGGGGGRYNTTNGNEDGRTSSDPGGGSGGGGGGGQASSSTGVGGGSGTYGYDGGNGSPSGGSQCGGGGGGAGAVGNLGGSSSGGTKGDGGVKVSNTITGSSVDYAGGGGGGNYEGGNTTIGGGAGAGAGGRGTGTAGHSASIANRGSGGGGAGGAGGGVGGTGSAGVVILRFPSTYTATLSGGVSSSSATVGTDTVLTITATSSSSETVTFS